MEERGVADVAAAVGEDEYEEGNDDGEIGGGDVARRGGSVGFFELEVEDLDALLDVDPGDVESEDVA